MKIKEKIKIIWESVRWKYQGIVLNWNVFKFPSMMRWIWAIKYLPVSFFISSGDEVWKSRFFKEWEIGKSFKFKSIIDWQWRIFIEKERSVVAETNWRRHRYISKFLQENRDNMSNQEWLDVKNIVDHEIKTMDSCVWMINALMVDEKSRITNMCITWISAICLAAFNCISLSIENSELLIFLNGVEVFLLIILLYFAFKLPLAIAKFLMLAKLSMKGAFERVEINCFKNITYFKQLKIKEEADSLKEMAIDNTRLKKIIAL